MPKRNDGENCKLNHCTSSPQILQITQNPATNLGKWGAKKPS